MLTGNKLKAVSYKKRQWILPERHAASCSVTEVFAMRLQIRCWISARGIPFHLTLVNARLSSQNLAELSILPSLPTSHFLPPTSSLVLYLNLFSLTDAKIALIPPTHLVWLVSPWLACILPASVIWLLLGHLQGKPVLGSTHLHENGTDYSQVVHIWKKWLKLIFFISYC